MLSEPHVPKAKVWFWVGESETSLFFCNSLVPILEPDSINLQSGGTGHGTWKVREIQSRKIIKGESVSCMHAL